MPERVADVQVTRAWSVETPAAGRVGALRVEGHDAQGRVRAGTVVGGRVRLLPFGEDPRLPDLQACRADAEVVVHRAGRRAVLRRAEGYVKVTRPGRARDVAARARQGRRRAVAAGLAAPEVLDAGDGWLTMTTVAGRDLHGAAADADLTQWRAWWRQWTQAWPALVTSDPEGLPTHTGADEAEVLRRAVGAALAWRSLPDPDGRGRSTTEQVCRGLAAAHDPRTGVGHRDLHDKQLLAGGARIGVLDFDTAAVAEPALDLANLAVHARWRRVQGVWTAEQADVVDGAAREVAHALGVPAWRWESYAAGTTLRLAAVYSFRPRWHAAALRWWDEAVGRGA